ncbi:MAG: hypothetical protein Q8Q20_03365 [bacterium]|nr:hypothetical protein [bacterium]
MARVSIQPKQSDDSTRSAKRRLIHFPRFRLGGCFTRFLGGVFLFGIAVAAIVAYFGFAEIPVLSKILYQPLSPTREIVFTEAEANGIGAVLTKKFTEQSLKGDPEILLTETELTILLHQSLVLAQKWPIERIQVAITPSEMEFYGVIPKENAKHRFIVTAKPKLDDGKLGMRVTGAQLERVRVPGAVASGVIEALIGGSLQSLNASLDDYLRVRELRLDKGELRVKGEVINPTVSF